jgi:ribosomal protein L37E
MEWRCEWCGKPHEENDPPCDNCGHGSFERAVVPVSGDTETLGSESAVWVCTACGREHTKHTPPCSRCGNDELELQRQEISDDELEVPGYLDLLTPRYLLLLVAVLAVAGVFVLGVTGVVDIPGFGGGGVPEVSDVPGDAASIGGISFSEAEAAYLTGLNDRRTGAEAASLSTNADLTSVAEFLNQKRVKGAGLSEGERERVQRVLGGACEGSPQVLTASVGTGTFDSAGALGEALVGSVAGDGGAAVEGSRTGVDLHATPDGQVYLLQVVC